MAFVSRADPPAGPRRTLPLRPRELLATLSGHAVDFVVIGGFALAPHGYVRATLDLDIVPDPANITRLADALGELDAAVDLGDLRAGELDIRPDQQGLSAGGNWGLATRYGRLDVMQDVPGLRSWTQLAPALAAGS